MTLIIFNHGAKGNAFFTPFMSKFEFLNIDNLHKKFGSDISKIVDFFYCRTLVVISVFFN